MTERFHEQVEQMPEQMMDQRYKEFQKAADELNRIREVISDILSRTQDRVEAERLIIERYSEYQNAMDRYRMASEAWWDVVLTPHHEMAIGRFKKQTMQMAIGFRNIDAEIEESYSKQLQEAHKSLLMFGGNLSE